MSLALSLGTVLVDTSVRAHGLGGRTDLPPDPGMAAVGAAVAVAVSFLVVLVAWPEHRLSAGTSGRALPRLTTVVDNRMFRATLRVIVLLAAALVIAVALLGPDESRFNLAPYALYIVFWVGLVFASVLVGPVWRLLNPLRTIHSFACRVGGLDRDEGVAVLSPRVGVWPGAAWLLVFVWLELVYPQRAEPTVVGLFLTAYCVVTVLLALVFGRRWFDAGDGFELYSRLFGSLAPVGRRPDGALALRSPLQGLAALRAVPGLTAAVVILIGSTGFDGLTRTATWQREVAPDSVPLGTAGLLALIGTVAVLYLAAMYVGARAAGIRGPKVAGTAGGGSGVSLSRSALPGLFAHSLIPIALGYTIAHYFSLFFFEGQAVLALASDPFGSGWDLFGTVDRSIDYGLLSPGVIARVQIYSIVLGHICGVVTAHDRALALLRPEVARRSQYPLAVVMVVITLCGVLLLLSG